MESISQWIITTTIILQPYYSQHGAGASDNMAVGRLAKVIVILDISPGWASKMSISYNPVRITEIRRKLLNQSWTPNCNSQMYLPITSLNSMWKTNLAQILLLDEA